MADEFEVVQHPQGSHINLFVVTVAYRTPHLHRDFELNYVLSGSVVLSTPQGSHTAGPGELFLLNPNQLHELRTGSREATILCLQVAPAFFRQAVPALGEFCFDRVFPLRCMSAHARQESLELLADLALHYLEEEPCHALRCQGKLSLLFAALLEAVPHRPVSGEEALTLGKRAERITRLLDYVDANYMHKVTLSGFAAREGLSLSYLSRFVRDNLHQTFQNYVATLRFHQACRLLLTSGKRIIDICYESGFSDPRYLNRLFLQNTGMTPEKYRRTYAGPPPDAARVHHSMHSRQTYYTRERNLQLVRALRDQLAAQHCAP